MVASGTYDVTPLGDVAQLEEHLLCKQGVVGSSPIVSTIRRAYSPPMPTRYLTTQVFQAGGSDMVWFWKLGTGDAYWGYSVRPAVVLRSTTFRWETLYTYVDESGQTEVIETKAGDDMKIVFAALQY